MTLLPKMYFVSHDVVFHETVFLFHLVSSNNEIIDPFPNLVLPHSSLDSLSSSFEQFSNNDSPSALLEPEFSSFSSLHDVPIHRSSQISKPPYL